ncbi:hypothetical protein [Glaesserella parasuis]|uniref:hypothetical protein n=1 Tax=Glaesserella parasuis TaxID=738 RepID=UPI00049FCA00|nr:hypothetical protein [Glaesserella parasuis]KDD79127.1 hypothetical protein HPS42_11125 [Glaesserella parasuis ST4-2]MCT8784089.1 hypothetical protein [Glaesserella parasuis]MDP0150167.1 hypothetical protein [Glaesserella parasuis]
MNQNQLMAFFKYKKRIEDMTPVELIQRGWPFNIFKNPTEEMKLLAIKENGYAIRYIKNPTEEMKQEADKQEDPLCFYKGK